MRCHSEFGMMRGIRSNGNSRSVPRPSLYTVNVMPCRRKERSACWRRSSNCAGIIEAELLENFGIVRTRHVRAPRTSRRKTTRPDNPRIASVKASLMAPLPYKRTVAESIRGSERTKESIGAIRDFSLSGSSHYRAIPCGRQGRAIRAPRKMNNYSEISAGSWAWRLALGVVFHPGFAIVRAGFGTRGTSRFRNSAIHSLHFARTVFRVRATGIVPAINIRKARHAHTVPTRQ